MEDLWVELVTLELQRRSYQIVIASILVPSVTLRKPLARHSTMSVAAEESTANSLETFRRASPFCGTSMAEESLWSIWMPSVGALLLRRVRKSTTSMSCRRCSCSWAMRCATSVPVHAHSLCHVVRQRRRELRKRGRW